MKSLVFKTNYFSVEAGVEAGAGVTKKPNRDAMASATVVNRNKKDHYDLVIISNKPVLEKSDVAKYNAIVRKENQKPHLPRETKKIIDRVYTSADDATRKKLEERVDPRVNN